MIGQTEHRQPAAKTMSLASIFEYTPSPLRERLSSVFGSISFSCWMILMVPQLVEQWRLKTVEGISPVFLLFWATGDIFNLVGAVWAGLLPEVILIALWFMLGDLVTFAFYFYISIVYDKKREARKASKTIVVDDESLLLGEHAIHYEHEVQASEYGATPGVSGPPPDHPQSENPHHHHHHHKRRRSSTLEDIVYEPENHSVFVRYILPLTLVISAGVFGSILSPNSQSTAANMQSAASTLSSSTSNTAIPQILGYCSAVLYLAARIPQIYHNYKKKSTTGLSLLFFLLTMLGNVTYSLQIIVYRWDREYLLLNLSWLLGSFGTIFEDLIIVTQFYLYRNKGRSVTV